MYIYVFFLVLYVYIYIYIWALAWSKTFTLYYYSTGQPSLHDKLHGGCKVGVRLRAGSRKSVKVH